MGDELRPVLDEIGKVHNEFKSYCESADAEIKRIGVEMPETKAALDKMNARLDTLEGSVTSLRRPSTPEADESRTKAAAVLAFRKALKSPDMLTKEERQLVQPVSVNAAGEIKSLATDNFAAAGALLAPAGFVEGIVKDLSEISPVRAHARLVTMSGKSVLVPVRTSPAVGAWVTERATTTEDTSLAYSQKELFAHDATCLYKATHQQLEDAAFAIEQEIAAEFTEAFAVLEGAAFISGNGVGKPMGILSDSGVTSGALASGSATAFDADDIIDLVATLKDIYYPCARFFLHRKTLAFLRKLKAGDGHYLWAPQFDAANPPTIEGFPYTFCTDLAYPTSGSYTTNTYPVLFANLANGYLVGDRKALTIQRLSEKYAETGEVGFLGTYRVGGMVVNSAAIKALKIST